MLRRLSSDMDTDIFRCIGVDYGVHLEEGVLRMKALPGFPDVKPTADIPLCDVIAVELLSQVVSGTPWSRAKQQLFPKSANDVPCIVLHLAYRVSRHKWRTRKIILESASVERGQLLYGSIKSYLRSLFDRPSRLMFFINPISGNGKSLRIFEKYLAPIMNLCDVSYAHEVTIHENHAREWILQQMPDESGKSFDGIVAVGGDGIFNEIMEAVITKEQNGSVLSTSNLRSPRVRLGIIPAGSTDSIAYCVGLGDPVTSLIHILLGHHMMLDVGAVFRLSDGGWLKYFCAFLGYGFFSDTLRNSEKRWLRRHLGKSRYLLAGARTFFVNRAYNGSVSFKTAGDIPEGYPDEGAQCYKGCGYCVDMGAGKSEDLTPRPEEQNTWRSLDGKFTNVIAANMSCRSEMSPRGVAPLSHCGNGCLDLLVMKSIGRMRLLRYLVGTSRGHGAQQTLGANLIACRAHELKFHAKASSEDRSGSLTTFWNCDGEIIRESNIHVKVYCQLINIYGSGLEPG